MCVVRQALRAGAAMEKRVRTTEDRADKKAAELDGELSDTRERLRDVEVDLSSSPRLFVFVDFFAGVVSSVFASKGDHRVHIINMRLHTVCPYSRKMAHSNSFHEYTRGIV